MKKELIFLGNKPFPSQILEKLDFSSVKNITFKQPNPESLIEKGILPETHPLIALDSSPYIHAQFWLRGFETLELTHNGAYHFQIHPDFRDRGASITYISTIASLPRTAKCQSEIYDQILYLVINEETIEQFSISNKHLSIMRALGYGFIKIIPCHTFKKDFIRNLLKIGILRDNITHIAISVPTYIAAQLWDEGFQTIEFANGGAYITKFAPILSTWIPLQRTRPSNDG
jgi:hypothetical protein